MANFFGDLWQFKRTFSCFYFIIIVYNTLTYRICVNWVFGNSRLLIVKFCGGVRSQMPSAQGVGTPYPAHCSRVNCVVTTDFIKQTTKGQFFYMIGDICIIYTDFRCDNRTAIKIMPSPNPTPHSEMQAFERWNDMMPETFES